MEANAFIDPDNEEQKTPNKTPVLFDRQVQTAEKQPPVLFDRQVQTAEKRPRPARNRARKTQQKPTKFVQPKARARGQQRRPVEFKNEVDQAGPLEQEFDIAISAKKDGIFETHRNPIKHPD